VIDWLTVRMESEYRPLQGHVASFTADGEIEWRTEKRMVVEGSHSAVITVRSVPDFLNLEISGNPVKFLQGHNLWGTDDLQGLVTHFLRGVFAKVGHRPSDDELERIRGGFLKILRIDLNRNSDFGSEPRALAAIRALSDVAHLTHRGRGSLVGEGTCIWGKGSRRWNLKAYAKRQELKKHPLHPDLPNVAALLAFSEGIVRREVTVRGMELHRRGLSFVNQWDKLKASPMALFDELAGQLSISEAAMLETSDLEKIPARYRPIYAAWAAGHDCRELLPLRTFYRYRKALLAYGVDIATNQPRDASNVVPLRVTLVGREVGVPDWARGTPLYFDPQAA